MQSQARWEREIAAFERADAEAPPPKGALLFTGASTIRLWRSLAQDFPRHRVLNRGFGGSHISDATFFAPRVIFPYAPRAVYFRSGGNDLADGRTVEQALADFEAFVAAMQAALPEVDVIFISLSPSLTRWGQAEPTRELNARVAAFVSGRPRLRYIDTYDVALGAGGRPRPELFARDGIHFNADGYRLFAERVRPDVLRAYPDTGAS